MNKQEKEMRLEVIKGFFRSTVITMHMMQMEDVDEKIVDVVCDILCNIQTRALSALDVTTDELQEAHEIVKQESKDIMEMAKLLGADAEALLNAEFNTGKT